MGRGDPTKVQYQRRGEVPSGGPPIAAQEGQPTSPSLSTSNDVVAISAGSRRPSGWEEKERSRNNECESQANYITNNNAIRDWVMNRLAASPLKVPSYPSPSLTGD